MDQGRQNEEIEELISAGAQVIFLTPVEWDTARTGLEAAAEARRSPVCRAEISPG